LISKPKLVLNILSNIFIHIFKKSKTKQKTNKSSLGGKWEKGERKKSSKL